MYANFLKNTFFDTIFLKFFLLSCVFLSLVKNPLPKEGGKEGTDQRSACAEEPIAREHGKKRREGVKPKAPAHKPRLCQLSRHGKDQAKAEKPHAKADPSPCQRKKPPRNQHRPRPKNGQKIYWAFI